jgi:2-dehydro-3-deoxygalactonokinase
MRWRICLDVGITQTRAWLMRDGEIIARASEMQGIRGGFISGSHHGALQSIDDAIAACLQAAGIRAEDARIECVAVAGMVTSELGPYPVAHLDGPGNAQDLAVGVVVREVSGIVIAPLFLVPGIRFGGDGASEANDAMRGEETLIVGLLDKGLMQPGEALLNLGSHWKLIRTDVSATIVDSYTGIGGELIFAIARETILKGALPAERPRDVSMVDVNQGLDRARKDGLGRALFLTRMDAQRAALPAERAYWQVVGAVIGDSESGILERVRGSGVHRVCVAGYPALGEAWREVLRQEGVTAQFLTELVVENAFCAGLMKIVDLVKAGNAL